MPSILVHQALHGYNDGHRLISSSLPLDASDARVMLVMSDLSGSGMKPSADGYLTGYPLEKSGKYVLARTWAAPEMPRPGCVWTHSLIIENADLARLMSAQALLDIFTRPTGIDVRSAYGDPVSMSPQLKPNGIEPTERTEFLLQALYSFPTRQVVAEAAEPFADEQVATAIWMQQWPRLRRSFGFARFREWIDPGKGLFLTFSSYPRRIVSSVRNFRTPWLRMELPSLKGRCVCWLISQPHHRLRCANSLNAPAATSMAVDALCCRYVNFIEAY